MVLSGLKKHQFNEDFIKIFNEDFIKIFNENMGYFIGAYVQYTEKLQTS